LNKDPVTGERKKWRKTVLGTKKEAQKVLTQMETELANGINPNESKLTVAEYIGRWITDRAPYLKQKTIDGYTVNIRKYINPAIGHLKIQELKPMHIQTMYTNLLSTKLKAKSVLYVHRTLHKALLDARKKQIVPQNVADLVDAPRAERYKSKVFSEQELASFLTRLKYTDCEVPFTIAALTGMRRGEIMALKWDDVDFANKTLTISRSLVPTSKGVLTNTPKSESGSRVIPLFDTLVTLLKRHQIKQKENKLKSFGNYEDNGYIYCRHDGESFAPDRLSKKFKRFLEINKLKHIRFHDLRHSYATLMLKYNVPAKIVSQILGHSNIGITLDLYSHAQLSMLREATEKIENAMFKMGGSS
jgi:integrase